VKAALAWRFDNQRAESRIEILLENIVPALDGIDPKLPHDQRVSAAVEANVRYIMATLLATPEAKARLAISDMRLVGAVYDLKTGRVRFLD
jgi:carbonic anhydrase